MAEEPKLVLPVDEDEYNKAGSRYVTFPPGAPVGAVEYRDAETGAIDWETPNKSMRLPITVTEDGPDKNKEEKISRYAESWVISKLVDRAFQRAVEDFKKKSGKTE